MKVEITKQKVMDIVGLAEVLTQPGGPKLGKKFAYALAYNAEQLAAHLKGVQAEDRQDKKYKKYDDERIKLAKELAKKDPRGEAMITPNGAFVFEDQSEFNAQHIKLREKHKTAIEARVERLDEAVEVKLHGVDLDDVSVQPNIPGGSELEGDFVEGSIMKVCLPFILNGDSK